MFYLCKVLNTFFTTKTVYKTKVQPASLKRILKDSYWMSWIPRKTENNLDRQPYFVNIVLPMRLEPK